MFKKNTLILSFLSLFLGTQAGADTCQSLYKLHMNCGETCVKKEKMDVRKLRCLKACDRLLLQNLHTHNCPHA